MGTRRAVAAMGILVIACVVVVVAFAVGVRVGEMRAARGLPPPPPFLPGPRPWFPGHGAFGTVEQVDEEAKTIAVVDPEGRRWRIVVASDTILVRSRQQIEIGAIKTGERVVAIGRPDREGRIVARVIRILEAPAGRSGLPAPWTPRPGLVFPRFLHRLLRWLIGRVGQ